MSASPSEPRVHVVGGGLAGCEAAWQLGRRGVPVVLHEMKPTRFSEAHQSADLCELVCSNSLGSLLDHTASGGFKSELLELGSLVVESALRARVPAGGALAVDREVFSSLVEGRLRSLGTVEVRRAELTDLPEPSDDRWIVATGPLTAPSLGEALRGVTGGGALYFYDAIAPIVDAETVDRDIAFRASRYGAGGGEGDYLNCPLDRAAYEAFVDLLLGAEQVPTRDFEPARLFGGCQPIEAIAASGRDSLRFGPMKPVGLTEPRTGRRPHAVVQLRQDNLRGSALNLVGFQTRLRYPEQQRVFRTIPGLAGAEFVRLGSVHRNTFVDAPRVLGPDLSLLARPDLRLAGQIVGCEGYTESSAMGLMAGLFTWAERAGRPLPAPPEDTLLGALMAWLRTPAPRGFQPMNVNFGLLPDPPGERVRDRKERRRRAVAHALSALRAWAETHGVREPFPGEGRILPLGEADLAGLPPA